MPASLGSKTQLVSLISAAFVVVALLTMRPLLAEIPRAALAAVIVSAAIAIIDVAGYRSLWQVSREEFVLAVATALGVIVFGVLVGVLLAVILAVVVALYRIARPHDAVLGDHPDTDGWVDIGAYPEAVAEPGLVVFRFDAPLFFVNAERFRDRVEQVLVDSPGEEEWLVLDFEGVGALDATALDVLAEVAAFGRGARGASRGGDPCERLGHRPSRVGQARRTGRTATNLSDHQRRSRRVPAARLLRSGDG